MRISHHILIAVAICSVVAPPPKAPDATAETAPPYKLSTLGEKHMNKNSTVTDEAGTTIRPEHVVELSNAFSELVRLHLPDHLDEIRDKNLSHNLGACATHDHCDANILMQLAFQNVFLRDPDILSDDGDLSGNDTELWNAAWAMAKACEFRGSANRPLKRMAEQKLTKRGQ